MAEDRLTQVDRIVNFVRRHPGCTVMEVTLGLSPFVANPRARMSDARAHGIAFDKWRDSDGVWRYRVAERPVPMVGEQLGAFR